MTCLKTDTFLYGRFFIFIFYGVISILTPTDRWPKWFFKRHGASVSILTWFFTFGLFEDTFFLFFYWHMTLPLKLIWFKIFWIDIYNVIYILKCHLFLSLIFNVTVYMFLLTIIFSLKIIKIFLKTRNIINCLKKYNTNKISQISQKLDISRGKIELLKKNENYHFFFSF